MTPLFGPSIDPTAIFEIFRGIYGSELLTAAIAHFDVFGRLARQPRSVSDLRDDLGLADRPFIVLTTALRAMGLLHMTETGTLELTPVASEHLVPGGEFDVGNYVSLSANSTGVLEIVARLKSNQPAGLSEDGDGAAFIYRDGLKSAMEQSSLAEHFTLALAGRARNVAPVLAEAVPVQTARTLLDVGGGTGIYSIGFVRKTPHLTATVLDRPEVLKTAEAFAQQYDVVKNIRLQPGDMFTDKLPASDIVLLSNILHDWDVPECQELVRRCAEALNPGGRLVIHDVLLNDQLDGPLPIALYSAALFTLTEGRAYSAAEYESWMNNAGLGTAAPVPTLIHCHAIVGTKR
ncbi:MAG: methyltransferase [Fuerstiella sp.]|jgi:SAM-dependent methyltransferase|nr:methyltransferase [Fuerstiella sp.]